MKHNSWRSERSVRCSSRHLPLRQRKSLGDLLVRKRLCSQPSLFCAVWWRCLRLRSTRRCCSCTPFAFLHAPLECLLFLLLLPPVLLLLLPLLPLLLLPIFGLLRSIETILFAAAKRFQRFAMLPVSAAAHVRMLLFCVDIHAVSTTRSPLQEHQA